MTESLVLDLILIAVLIAYIVYGFRHGLSRSIFVIAGVVAGVVAAFFLAPLAATWVPVAFLRPAVTIFVAIGLVGLGHALGGAIGRRVRRGVARSPLGGFDRVLGALVTGIAAALVASVVAFSAGQLGVPVLSKAIAGSTILRTISTFTPDPVQALLAQVRAAVIDRGIPLITEALGDETGTIPQIDTGSPALNTAAQSIVRITGNAYACGRSQSGTGFVISDDRIITNAHVVAGVSEPVIEAPDGEVVTGSIVYFDPIDDLAVISAPGLTAAAIAQVGSVTAGTDVVVQGYPYGGPFTSGAAGVISVSTARIADIYSVTSTDREVYTLAATVREGNSGGPVLTLDGRVTGVVFARSADNDEVGYAMTMAELGPVASQAPALVEAVSTGNCITE
ncbi:MAG: MarP family serine protease [Salinibacterium sp.]|nr:MarP family serine protease [Salinibacterium sp.]